MGGVSVRETDCRCPADDQRGPGGPGQGAPSPHEISYLDDIRGDAVCVYQAGVDLPVMVDEYAVQVYLALAVLLVQLAQHGLLVFRRMPRSDGGEVPRSAFKVAVDAFDPCFF